MFLLACPYSQQNVVELLIAFHISLMPNYLRNLMREIEVKHGYWWW